VRAGCAVDFGLEIRFIAGVDRAGIRVVRRNHYPT